MNVNKKLAVFIITFMSLSTSYRLNRVWLRSRVTAYFVIVAGCYNTYFVINGYGRALTEALSYGFRRAHLLHTVIVRVLLLLLCLT